MGFQHWESAGGIYRNSVRTFFDMHTHKNIASSHPTRNKCINFFKHHLSTKITTMLTLPESYDVTSTFQFGNTTYSQTQHIAGCWVLENSALIPYDYLLGIYWCLLIDKIRFYNWQRFIKSAMLCCQLCLICWCVPYDRLVDHKHIYTS